MKKIILASILGVTVVLGSVVYVALSHADSSEKTVASTTESIEEKTAETQSMTTNDIMEQVYKANGFNESDRRNNSELVILTSGNNSNAKSINSETNKAYIYDRMLNSIDYFSSLQATYFYNSSNSYSYYSTYRIQQGKNPKSKEFIFNENGEIVSICSFDGEYRANINGDGESTKVDADANEQKSINTIQNKAIEEKIKNKINEITAKETQLINNDTIYQKTLVDIESSKNLDFVSLVDSKKRIKYIPEAEEDCYFYRNNLPQLPMSNIQYFSQDYAFGLLADFDKWDIDRMDEILGRECFVISGETEGDYSEKINTNEFEMWIDKETGVLLTLECYDNNGDLSAVLSTSEFIVDESINQSVFDDLSNIN